MTIFWHKDAGSKTTEIVPPTQVSELSHLFTHPETHSADRFAAAMPQRTTLIQPLFHLERELATASDIQDAVHALLRAIDSLLEPALSCVVMVSIGRGTRGRLAVCALGRAKQRTQLARLGPTSHPLRWRGNKRNGRAGFVPAGFPPHDMAEYVIRDAVCLPFQVEERTAGSVCSGPRARPGQRQISRQHAWPCRSRLRPSTACCSRVPSRRCSRNYCNARSRYRGSSRESQSL